MLETLKERVCRANRELVAHGLVALTWGNASGIDRQRELAAIKPSGVSYDELSPERIVVVDFAGRVVEGEGRPSSDTPTHLYLYRHMPSIGGIVHTHSRHATMFAQARQEIPCLGTTHADHFHGPVPVTRPLSPSEVEEDYEVNTGRAIVERFAELDPTSMPAALVAGHGPFAWGNDVSEAVHNAVALEAVAEMALGTRLIDAKAVVLEPYLLNKHFLRKHGPGAYYGQD
ncbi:MAG: L-ribulose-5-phosphate 4-epimerase AraD [Pirellulales bacterium]|nr:L-ribulose-5-phosphate 4-epimerase AraD [Pirellulales bacterium]